MIEQDKGLKQLEQKNKSLEAQNKQIDEVKKQLLHVLDDENCVNRIYEHFKDDEFRSAVQEKVKHEAHRQLLLVREAWDKVKANQEASGIDRSLEQMQLAGHRVPKPGHVVVVAHPLV